MANRFYFVPKIGTGSTPFDAFRPKYTDPDSVQSGWNLAGRWSAIDYGLENAFLLVADVTGAEHTALNAQTDVLAVPTPLDSTVSGGALATVRSKLEGLNLPGNWVTTSHTYREVLKTARKIIHFIQRFRGLFGEALLLGGLTLDSTINQIPQAKRQRLANTATDLGLDTSSITGTTTIRAALRTLADQLPNISMGGETV